MEATYMAVEATAPGTLRIAARPVREPGVGQVRIRVEACGICQTDTFTIEGQFPGLTFPRVPGHEVVGRIEAIGPDVSRWKVGQRVGVGFFGGEDGECEPCRRGDRARRPSGSPPRANPAAPLLRPRLGCRYTNAPPIQSLAFPFRAPARLRPYGTPFAARTGCQDVQAHQHPVPPPSRRRAEAHCEVRCRL